MQLSRAISLILLWLQVASAAPAILERRQASVIKGALSKVMASLKDLDTSVQGLTSDPKSVTPLLSSVESTQKSLTEASTTIKSAKTLGLFEAISMMQPANDLVAQVKTTLGDLTNKKPVFDQLGASPVVADSLKQQKVASSGLADAMLSKLPQLAQGLAGGTTDQLNKAVDDAIKAFSAAPVAAPKPASPAPAAPAPVAPAAPVSSPVPSVPNPAPQVPGPVPLNPVNSTVLA